LPFQLMIPDSEQEYLDNLPLSTEAKEQIYRFIEQTIADIPDEFRLDPENRCKPDSSCFRIRHIILDRWGDNRLYVIDFHILDDKAKFGVLLIAYIEYH
jgi:hypothetical protein